MFLAFLFGVLFLLAGPGRLFADEAYTCEFIEYRDPTYPNKAGWLITEEQGRRLIVHVGNTNQFDSIYIRVHGRAKWEVLGMGRFLSAGRNWQETRRGANQLCEEWQKKAARAQQPTVPPAGEERQPPRLAELVVEQRHLVRDKAQFRVSARAEYRDIGAFRPGEITFTVMARPGQGRNDLSWTLRPGESSVRQQGNQLMLDFRGEIVQPGTYTVRVVLRDARFRSGAHREFGYEDQLRLTMQVQRPAAVIKESAGNVAVRRIEPATATGGVRVKAGGQVYPSQKPDLLQDIAAITGDWQPDPYANPGQRWERASNRFVYEGDKISLWGERDRTRVREFMNSGGIAGHSVDELIAVMSSGVSRVVLEWRDGLKGEAIWDPRPGMANMSGEFIVGASRATSGKWLESWKSLFGQAVQVLFEQGVDHAKDQALEWILGFSMPSGGPYVGLFEFGAGDTVHDDLVYVRLKSKVYIRGGRGQLELFTLQGAPEIVEARTNRRTVVRPGQVATVKRGGVSSPRPFRSGDMLPAHWLREPAAERRSDRQRLVDGREVAGNSSGATGGQGGVNQRKLFLNAAIVKFALFAGGRTPPAFAERRFQDVFSSRNTRYINWHLQLLHQARSEPKPFAIETVWRWSDGREVVRHKNQFSMPAGTPETYYDTGWGNDQGNFWQPGSYRVSLYLEGVEIAAKSFTVTP
jgi:hypothetical protein